MKFGPLVAAGLFAALSFSAPAHAVSNVQKVEAGAPLVQVYGGCGPYRHRGPYGGCRPGGQAGGYVRGRSCPRGFHIGPYGRRCVPNRY